MQISRRRFVPPRRVFQRRDVRAGDERAAGALDDDGGRLGLAPGTIDRSRKRLRHARTERVDGRVVDLDDQHVAVPAGPDRICHRE